MEKYGITLDQTIPSGIETMLTAGAILVLSAFIVFFIIVKRRWEGRIAPFFIGIIGYLGFGFIFAKLAVSLLLFLPGVEQSFKLNENAYIIMDTIFTVLGLAIARFLTVKIIEDKYERRGDVLFGGTGIAFGNALVAYGTSILTYYVYSMGIKSNGLEAILKDVEEANSPEEYEQIQSIIAQLYNSVDTYWLFLGASALLDVVINVLLFVIVFGALKKNINSIYSYLAMVVQFISMMIFQPYDVNSVEVVGGFMLAKIAFVVIVGLLSYRFLLKEIAYKND